MRIQKAAPFTALREAAEFWKVNYKIIERIDKMQDEFSKFHPIVNFIYFLFVILFTVFFNHPAAIFLSFFSAAAYSCVQDGTKFIKSIKYYFALLLITAALNPLFNHEGVTIITYFKNGNPLTLESIAYGLSAAGMLLASICWFFCVNKVFTTDKIICVFGKIFPVSSLIISMSLRFFDRFAKKLVSVRYARQGISMDISEKGIINKIKNGAAIFSVMITCALENSIETADSMKSRGFGIRGRTSYNDYKFEKRDIAALLYISVLGIIIIAGAAQGSFNFRYFPGFGSFNVDILIFSAYFMLLIMPVFISVLGEVRWRCTQSKI